MMVSDEEKRWLVVGIAMNKVAASVLRDFIKQGMDTHYTNLDIYCSGLATPCTLKTLTYHQVSTDPCFKHLKFQNVNNNLQLYGMKKKDLRKYNFNINSSVDLAKLFLPDYLAEFSGFDESLDMSAILRLLGFNNPAPIFYSPNPLISIQLSADNVRDNVRNTWGHCNVTDWTEVFFSDCFSKLKTLVRSLGLTLGKEKMALDQLSDWETKGCQLCMGHAVDHNLLSLVQQDVKKLIMDYKTTEESLAQQRVDLTAMQNTVTSVQDQQSATRAQLEEHDEQLAAVLEWKEEQVKENQEILAKLVSVKKMLSEELLIRVEEMEKGLAETDDKVEQLKKGFAKTEDKVEQLEQGFAKTDDKVEQLEQGFAKTDDKVEQLEQGFAKTDDKVEQLFAETGVKVEKLEQEFARTDDKVETLQQGVAKTDYKVEQLEQGFAKTDAKVEQLQQGFTETDDKVEQLEQGFARTDATVEQLEQGFAKTDAKVEQLQQGFTETDDKVEQLEQGFAKTDATVEQLEQGFAKTDDKVEQLQQGFVKTDDKVEQLEQGVAKTDDKVEQLKQGFAKTDDKVEQLQQGFAKADAKVEQLEQGFAKIEKDASETGNKVKQLEEEVRSQRMKETKSVEDSAVETFDVKSCRSKLAEHYKRTASVPTSVWTKKSPVDIHQIYTRLSWVKEEQTPAGSSRSELKHYTDVFTANKNGVVPKRILVQGQTGIGKSTFVKKLSVDFAEFDDKITGDTKKDALRRFQDGEDVVVSEDKEAAFQDYEDPSRSSGKNEDMSENQKESLKKFELVLAINLKEVSKCPSLREILRCCSIFPEEETALVDDLLSYITKNQEKVLLVFDGYDEYRCGSNSEIYKIFRGKKLRNCCVLITTRISKADELREFKDVHAEITGFSEKDRVDFMIKFLGGKAEAEELGRHLSRKKLTDLTRVPLLLLFFCTLWKKGKLKSLPETKTKLYLGIVQYVLDYNQGKDSPARFGKVHDFKDILAEIGKVALECLLQDDHVFEYDELSAAILCDESFIIGLLQVTEYAENLRPSGMVSFIHKSIQEFLAAWYIANSCVPDGNLGGIEQHALTLEDFQAWENVFQFVCGLSDDGAVKVLQLLTSLRISDPTLDVSKIVPDVENETVVPLCDISYRHESFRNVAYDSFQEVNSKAELLSHWFDCNGRIFLVSTERPLPDLIPRVDDFTKLAHSHGAQVIFCWDSMVHNLLKFLDCLHKPISKSGSSEVLTFDDFLRKFEKIFFMSSVSSILCFRNGKFHIYLTGLELHHDFVAHLFAETIADSCLSPSANMSSEWSCLKFLTSLRCWCGLSGQSCRALGAAIRDCEHLKRIVVNECDDSITDLLEHVRKPSKCSLEIGSFFIRTKEGNSPKCHLTSSGVVKFASLISKFANIISLCLDFSNCCFAAEDTLVASITHNTLKQLVLHGMRLTPTVAALLGRSLPEMSSLEVLELTGLDGSILEAGEIEALYGGFNKTLPLTRLTLSGFSVRGCLSPLAKSLRFFPTLSELKLEKLNMDEHAQCSLLQSFGFIPNLKVMKVQSKALRHPCCCTAKVSTGHGYRLGDYKTLELNGISLTPTVAVALGRLLSEMSFLQELELTDVDGSILQAEEMEALFGRCNTMMPLCKLVFSGFKVGGCLAPLTKSVHFSNLRELKLEKLNMNENDQCGLLESLPSIRNLTALKIQTRPQGGADCCAAELNTDNYFKATAFKSLALKGIILTQTTTAALGQSLSEMLSLQALEVTGMRHESILQTKEIEALFGRFNRKLPLYSLIFRDFSVTGSIAPLTKSFCYFPNLRELNLAEINMDEHNLCGLLENLRFAPNLMELRVDGKPLDHADCCTAKGNTVGGFPLKTLKELTLYGVCLTPAVATMLGQILPEMSSLQEFVLSGVDGSVIKAEEMEALFGGLNKTLPLHHLTFRVFSVRGSFAPLKSFRFLANLRALRLGGLNMGEHNLCALLESLKFIPSLKVLTVKGSPQGDAHCCSAELNVMASITHKTLEHLSLDGISLTPVSAALLGRSLPEMSSLQVLELTGVDGSIQLQAKEMEALLGGFNKTLPLYRLTLRNFSSRGCLATLCKSFRFFPNLRQLSVEQMNMDERDVCSLLQNLRFIHSLRALKVQSEDQRDAGCYTAKLNTFGSSTIEIHEKLNLNGISLTPAAAAALGRSLPEMVSLQILEITGRDRRILQGEEMEALFGGFDKPIPLRELTFSGFSVKGCLAPLIRSLHFLPNLTELRLERLNMDENDQCGLLKSFGPIRNLTELSVCIGRWSDLDSFHYHSSKTNIFDRLAHDRDLLEKRLTLDGISLTPAVAAVFGLLLPEMSFLHTLEVTGVNRSILEAEEMEVLFCRLNETLPLHKLTLRSLSMKGCLSPLYRSFHFFPSLRELNLEDLDMGEHDSCFLKPLCCKAEITARVCSGKVTYKNLEQLKLDRITLTPAAALALGQSLPEMSSLQVLQLTHMDRSILRAEEMEALFGGFNETMQLLQLTLTGFSVRGCLAPLFKSLRFFPNLTELNLDMLNMDEHDLNGLLDSFQFIPNLQELILSRNPLGHSVRCIVPHVINLKTLRFLWIEQTDHSEEDLIYVRDTVQQALPELKIRGGTGPSSGCNQM